MRGGAQNKTMTPDIISATFENIKRVGNLVIGGGEPSLAVEAIHQIYQQILWKKVEIENIFIVTNGKTVSKKLLIEFNKLYGLCGDSSEISGFAISNDEFHEKARGFYRSIEDYTELMYDSYEEETDDFSNINEDLIQEHTNKDTMNWLARGRAKDFGNNHDAYLDNLKLDDFENPKQIHGEIYVCYNGDVLGDQNMSYTDMKKHMRGNVLYWDTLLQNLKQSTIENYNWCLHNCKYSTPDPDEQNCCSEWFDCGNAGRAIKINTHDKIIAEKKGA